MRHFKILDGNYITATGMSRDESAEYDHEITQEEYNTICTAVRNIPKNPPEGYRYRLEDSTKEYVLLESTPAPPEPEYATPDDIAEALEGIA